MRVRVLITITASTARPPPPFSAVSWRESYPGAHFSFTGLAHKASQLFEPGMFDGDISAIVDFKYSTDPHLTWWFDHHQAPSSRPRTASISVTIQRPQILRSRLSLLHEVHRHRGREFGYDAADSRSWWLADIVDGALYRRSGSRRSSTPATQLTLTIEGSQGSETVQKIIRMMRHGAG
jgi:hypothetical protein